MSSKRPRSEVESMSLAIGMACEVNLAIAGGQREVMHSWTKGYIVKEVGPVVRVLDLVRGHIANYPPTHVRAVVASSSHDAWLELTPAMRKCLEDARASWHARISPWDYGSSTIGALKRLGYIEGKREMLGGKAATRYAITDAGLRALEES